MPSPEGTNKFDIMWGIWCHNQTYCQSTCVFSRRHKHVWYQVRGRGIWCDNETHSQGTCVFSRRHNICMISCQGMVWKPDIVSELGCVSSRRHEQNPSTIIGWNGAMTLCMQTIKLTFICSSSLEVSREYLHISLCNDCSCHSYGRNSFMLITAHPGSPVVLVLHPAL